MIQTHFAKLRRSYSVLLPDEQLQLVESIRTARRELVVKKAGKRKRADAVDANLVKKAKAPKKASSRISKKKAKSLAQMSTEELLELLKTNK